jgi:hypothetical protein
MGTCRDTPALRSLLPAPIPPIFFVKRFHPYPYLTVCHGIRGTEWSEESGQRGRANPG